MIWIYILSIFFLSSFSWDQPSVLSLVRLFGICLLRMSLLLLPQAAPSLLSFFLPFYHQLPDSSSLQAIFACMSQVPPFIWPHAASPLVSFLFSFWAWNDTGRIGFLLSWCLWGQATNMYPFGVLVFSSFHQWGLLEVGDCKLAAGIWPAGQWFSAWVLRELWKRVSEKVQIDPLVWLGHHLALWLLTSGGCHMLTTFFERQWVWDPWSCATNSDWWNQCARFDLALRAQFCNPTGWESIGRDRS